MPMTLNMQVRSGMAMTPATMRGDTRYFTGLMAMACMASICSVTLMDANSAAMAEPVRPVTMKADSTGPSSRKQAQRHHRSQEALGVELPQAVVALKPQHHAGEEAGQEHDQQRVHSDGADLLYDEADLGGGPQRPGQGRAQEDHARAHAGHDAERPSADVCEECGHTAKGLNSIPVRLDPRDAIVDRSRRTDGLLVRSIF